MRGAKNQAARQSRLMFARADIESQSNGYVPALISPRLARFGSLSGREFSALREALFVKSLDDARIIPPVCVLVKRLVFSLPRNGNRVIQIKLST